MSALTHRSPVCCCSVTRRCDLTAGTYAGKRAGNVMVSLSAVHAARSSGHGTDDACAAGRMHACTQAAAYSRPELLDWPQLYRTKPRMPASASAPSQAPSSEW